MPRKKKRKGAKKDALPKPPRLRKPRGAHLTFHDRKIIAEWYNWNLQQPKCRRYTLNQLAEHFGLCRQTLWREIKRGKITTPNWHRDKPYYDYSPHKAQDTIQSRWINKGPPQHITNRIADELRIEIVDNKHSPAHALHTMYTRNPRRWLPCVNTVYNHIHDLSLGITWKDLPYHLNPKRKPKQPNRNEYRIIRNNTSIEQRPVEISLRQEYGHWEMDLVVSKHRQALLSMIERKHRELVLAKLKDKKQATIERAVRRLLKTGEIPTLLSITTDNGSEFINSVHFKEAINCPTLQDIYYCHPRSPQEKGSVENVNRHIRRWIPKGTNVAQLTRKEILTIQNHINSIPRKGCTRHSSSTTYSRRKKSG